MAESKIPLPSSNKRMEVVAINKTVDSTGCISFDSTTFLAGVYINNPAGAIGVKSDTTHMRILQAQWNGSLSGFVFKELAQGTQIGGFAIFV